MLGKVVSFVAGMGVMYFGSEAVKDNCMSAMWASEKTLQNQELIDHKACERIAQWACEGTLNQHVNELLPQYTSNQNFQSQAVQPQR